MAVYLTIDGDVLDRIVWDHYGDLTQLDAVLTANPGLAARGAVLGSGIEITLPEQSAVVVEPQIRLWGGS